MDAQSHLSRRQFLRGASALTAVSMLSAPGAAEAAAVPAPAQVEFTGQELLGCPTDTSVTINVVPDAAIDLYFEYGPAPGAYTGQTPVASAGPDEPHETVITGLSPNTRYYYRMQHTAGDGWVARDEHAFWTQRAPGSTFTFTVIADSHLGNLGNAGRYEQATLNVAADAPDLHLDLGDTFVTNDVESQAEANQVYLEQRPYFDRFAHSTAVFLALGNHENEEGWNFDDTPVSKAITSANARKRYYPTPIPDSFYSGNSDDSCTAIEGDHLREDYYAWEWGDALFVVLDPFQYTMTNPYGTTAGEGSDDPPSGDQWNWTLGQQQFAWLKQVLGVSDAAYKFVFAHHVTGGQVDGVPDRIGGPEYVRGGAEAVPYFEWGGREADGAWLFDEKRAGWGDQPIHQLMVRNCVSAFFHGHDHQYAYEVRDGIVYQEVPSPSMRGDGFDLYSESDPYTEKVLPNSGHLRVTVAPDVATVEYVRSDTDGSNGEISHSYTIRPCRRRAFLPFVRGG